MHVISRKKERSFYNIIDINKSRKAILAKYWQNPYHGSHSSYIYLNLNMQSVQFSSSRRKEENL